MLHKTFFILLIIGNWLVSEAQELTGPAQSWKFGGNTFISSGLDKNFLLYRDSLNILHMIDIKSSDTVFSYHTSFDKPVFDFIHSEEMLINLDDLDGNFTFIPTKIISTSALQKDTLGVLENYLGEKHPGLRPIMNERGVFIKPEKSSNYILSCKLSSINKNNIRIKSALSRKEMTITISDQTIEDKISLSSGTKTKSEEEFRFIELDKLYSDNQHKRFTQQHIEVSGIFALSANEIILAVEDSVKTELYKAGLESSTKLFSKEYYSAPTSLNKIYTTDQKLLNCVMGPSRKHLVFNQNDELCVYEINTNKIVFSMAGRILVRFSEAGDYIVFSDPTESVYEYYSLQQNQFLEQQKADFSFASIDTITDPVRSKQIKEASKLFGKSKSHVYDDIHKLVYLSAKDGVHVLDQESLTIRYFIPKKRYDELYLLSGNRLLGFARELNQADLWNLDEQSMLIYKTN